MVELFKPSFLQVRKINRKEFYATQTELNNDDLEEFMLAKKGKRLDDYRESHLGFFTPYSWAKQSRESFNAAQDVLNLALSLKHMLETKNYDLETCPNCGCARVVPELNEDQNGNPFTLFYIEICLPPCEYRDYLLRNLNDEVTTVSNNEMRISFRGYESATNISTGNTQLFIELENLDQAENIKEAIDALFTIHLINIKTVSIDGGKEHREASEGITMIWWLVLDRFRDGRIGICEFCGKPFIAKQERGELRKFCSNSCKQRAYKSRKEKNPTR